MSEETAGWQKLVHNQLWQLAEHMDAETASVIYATPKGMQIGESYPEEIPEEFLRDKAFVARLRSFCRFEVTAQNKSGSTASLLAIPLVRPPATDGNSSDDQNSRCFLVFRLRRRLLRRARADVPDLTGLSYLLGTAHVRVVRASSEAAKREALAHRSFLALLREDDPSRGPFQATLENFLQVLQCPVGTIWEYHSGEISGEPYMTLEGAIPYDIDRYDRPCLPKGVGLVWQVMDAPEKIVSKSNIADHEIANRQLYPDYQNREILILRLETPAKVYGAICLSRDTSFDLSSVRAVLEMFEKVAALEIHNKVLEQKAALLERVSAIVPTVESTLAKSSRAVAESVRSIVGALAVSIFLKPDLDPEARTIQLTAASTHSSATESVELQAFREGSRKIEYDVQARSLTARVCRDAAPIVCNDVLEHPENSHTFREIVLDGYNTWVGVPLFDGHDKVVGVIRCFGKVRNGSTPMRPYIFDDFDVFALRHIASVTAPIFQTIRTISELDRLNQSLKMAERIREHEVRAPLASITANASFVKQYLTDPSATSKERRLEEIISDAQMCAFLLREARVPDEAEFEKGLVYTSPTSIVLELTKFLQRAVRQRSPLKTIITWEELDKELPIDEFMEIDFQGSAPRALLNKHLLQRALYNLGVNAIKYGRPGGYLHIRLEEIEGEGTSTIVMDFEDSGVGIPDADVERIFATGYRGSNVREKISGEGLGLSIARSIVLAHRGTITVESPRNPTLFRLRLPLRVPPRGREEAYQGGQLRRFDLPRNKGQRRRN